MYFNSNICQVTVNGMAFTIPAEKVSELLNFIQTIKVSHESSPYINLNGKTLVTG